MNKIINIILVITMISMGAGGASGDTIQTYVIPKSFDFTENYYYVYGSPDIQATIVGSNEFERGQTVTLFIDLMNKGKLLGFEIDEDPSGTDEIFAAETEIKLERNIVDASGVMVFLASNPGNLIEVKSISQQVGSLRSGQNTVLPLKFDVTIDKKAKAGEYNLSLNLTYDYQKNVQVVDANAETKTYEANYWYGMIAQNQTLTINVKKQADFEIVNTTKSVVTGNENIIEITLKNTGEEEARDIKVIISPSDPISTTDDKAYVSSIAPGGVAAVKFRIKAESGALPKTYAIDTVIRYQTPEGETKYSDTLYAFLEVTEIGWFQKWFGWIK